SSASLVMLESESDYLEFDIRPEDDAGVVRDRAATTILDATRDRIASELTEPRARFMAWFDRLENQPGFMFYPTDELRAALAAMPQDAFVVPLAPLEPTLRKRDQLSAQLVSSLADRSFDSATLEEEAQRRLESHGTDDALMVLSSLVEENPGNPVVARDV